MANPLLIIKEAISKVPIVKYALAVAGIAAAAAIVKSFQLEGAQKFPIITIMVMLACMILLFLFSTLTRAKDPVLKGCGYVLVVSTVLITCTAAFFLMTSVFFKWPTAIAEIVVTDQNHKSLPDDTTNGKAAMSIEVIRLRLNDLENSRANIANVLNEIMSGNAGEINPFNKINDLNNGLIDFWLTIVGYGLGSDPYVDKNIMVMSNGFNSAKLPPDYGITELSTHIGIPRLFANICPKAEISAQNYSEAKKNTSEYSNPAVYPFRDFSDRAINFYRSGQKLDSPEFQNDVKKLTFWLNTLEANLKRLRYMVDNPCGTKKDTPPSVDRDKLFQEALKHEKKQNYGLAAAQYKEAAELGQVDAQISWGRILSEGLYGIDKDVSEGGHWFELAAKNNNTTAQTFYGNYLLHENNKLAAEVQFRKAALITKKPNPTALYLLGAMFEQGSVRNGQNLDSAIILYKMACKNGLSIATEHLKKLGHKCI